MKYLTPFIATGLLFLGSASAEGYDLMKDGFSRQDRIELAKTYKERISKLDEAIPTLSPSQKEWLRKEYDENNQSGGNVRRAMAASDSKEFNIRLAKRMTSENRKIITRLASEKFETRREEAYLWAIFAVNLSYYEATHALFNLAERGMFDMSLTNGQGSDDKLIAEHVRESQAHAIYANFVAPYLRDRGVE